METSQFNELSMRQTQANGEDGVENTQEMADQPTELSEEQQQSRRRWHWLRRGQLLQEEDDRLYYNE